MLIHGIAAAWLVFAAPCVSSENTKSPNRCSETETRVADHAKKDTIWARYWSMSSSREQSNLSSALYDKVADKVKIDSQLLRKLVRYGLYFDGNSIYRHQIKNRYPHYSIGKIDADLKALNLAGLIAKQEMHYEITRLGSLSLAFFVEERRKLGTYMPQNIGQALAKIARAFDARLGKDGSAYKARRNNRFRIDTESSANSHDFDLFLDLLAARNLISHNRFEQMGTNTKTTSLRGTPLSQEILDGVARGWLTSAKMCAERSAWGQTAQSCQAAFNHLVRLQLISEAEQGHFSATESGFLVNKQANDLADSHFYSAFDALTHSEYCVFKNYLFSATGE